VGKSAGTLVGFPVKDMEVEIGGIRRKCGEIYVAIWQERLSETGAYNILLQPAMLEL
ncbi:MAG: sigma-E processing peptidase SpoIIGA, partial [Acetatifactor sp.]|nr:sigma-E processing peptidase SpoIIGA [Acetatifactor sp.]